MAIFSLKMRPARLPNHSSTCPICSDTDSQCGWVLGINKLNQTIIRASAILDNYLVEATFSYCQKCDFGYFFPTPPQSMLDNFYALGGGRGELRSDEIELASIRSVSSKETVATFFSKMRDCGVSIESFKGLRVLEVGPGLSCFIPAFLEHEIEYFANEIGMLTSNFIERVFDSTVIREPLEAIPIEYDGNFDLIFSKDSLEHHPNPTRSLQRMKDLLSPDGWMVISVPNLNSYSFKEASITHPYYAFPPHLNYFSGNTFTKYLREIGMKNIQVRTFSTPEQVLYCMELCIKLGLINHDGSQMENLTASGRHESLLVVAQNSN